MLAVLSESVRQHIDDVLKIAAAFGVIVAPTGRWIHKRQQATSGRLDKIEKSLDRLTVYVEIVVDELAEQRPSITQRLRDAGAGFDR
jgi:methylaspartate ammonia-lyase